MFALPCIMPRLHFHNHPPSSHIYLPLPIFPFQCLDLGCEWGVILMTLFAHCFGCWLACSSSLFGPSTETLTLWGLGDSACLWPAQEGRAFNGWMATRESERGDGGASSPPANNPLHEGASSPLRPGNGPVIIPGGGRLQKSGRLKLSLRWISILAALR